MEQIVSITDFDDAMSGYRIETTERVLKIGISNYQDCCEDWGYMHSEDTDDFGFYVGADLLSIQYTDVDNVKCDIDLNMLDCGGAMFLDLNTSRGTVQFVAYNSHNGYYSHGAKIWEEKDGQSNELESVYL